MIDYRSDNTGRAAPEILDAMIRANRGTALGYGGDEWTARLQDRFSELFETRVRVFPVATGTAANALSLAAIGPGWGNIYCSEAAHINTSEANAAGFLGGGLKLARLNRVIESGSWAGRAYLGVMLFLTASNRGWFGVLPGM